MLKHLFKGTKWDVPCERCGVVLSECKCRPPAAPVAESAKSETASRRARIRVEKRAKGKRVTVVSGLTKAQMEELAPKLKAACGAGGTVRDDELEIQGEHAKKIVEVLAKEGIEAKAS